MGQLQGVLAREPSQVLQPAEASSLHLSSHGFPTAGPQIARQVVKKVVESHDGPGKGFQAVIPHTVASLLSAGWGQAQPPVSG